MSAESTAWRVHKFGGSGVADAACMERVARILEDHRLHRADARRTADGIRSAAEARIARLSKH